MIVPHLGLLNGGYRPLCRLGVWDQPDVFTDTALAPPDAIADYVRNYGSARIMFGSDFPFGDPGAELEKIRRLRFSEEIQEAVLGGNILRLMAGSNRPRKWRSRALVRSRGPNTMPRVIVHRATYDLAVVREKIFAILDGLGARQRIGHRTPGF